MAYLGRAATVEFSKRINLINSYGPNRRYYGRISQERQEGRRRCTLQGKPDKKRGKGKPRERSREKSKKGKLCVGRLDLLVCVCHNRLCTYRIKLPRFQESNAVGV